MGRILPLVLFGLGDASLLPNREVRSANIMLGEGPNHFVQEFCRKDHLPPMDFARYENSCDGLTDTEINSGTTCQYQCISFRDVSPVHNVTCKCRPSLSDPVDGHDACGWVFDGDDSENTYQCGKTIVREMFLENKENYVRIRKDFYATSKYYLDSIEELHLDLHGWTNLHLATVESLYEETEAQIAAREAEDAAIVREMQQKNLTLHYDMRKEAQLSNYTLFKALDDQHYGLEAALVGDLINMEATVTNNTEVLLGAQEDTLKIGRAQKVYTLIYDGLPNEIADMNNTILSTVDGQYTYTEAAVDAAIGIMSISNPAAFDAMGQEHEAWQAELMQNATDSLNSTGSDYINATFHALETYLTNKINWATDEVEGSLQYAIDYMELINTHLQDTSKVADPLNVSPTEAQGLSDAMFVYINETMMAEYKEKMCQKIKTVSPDNQVKPETYVDNHATSMDTSLNALLDAAQLRIDDHNAQQRLDAVSEANLYSDDIMETLRHKLHTQIEAEREKTRDLIFNTELDINAELGEVDEEVKTILEEHDTTYSEKMNAELAKIWDQYEETDVKLSKDVENIYDEYSVKIETRAEGTTNKIVDMRTRIADKLNALVDKVTFEMDHAREQLMFLRATTFF